VISLRRKHNFKIRECLDRTEEQLNRYRYRPGIFEPEVHAHGTITHIDTISPDWEKLNETCQLVKGGGDNEILRNGALATYCMSWFCNFDFQKVM
jgi:hypothetical protein